MAGSGGSGSASKALFYMRSAKNFLNQKALKYIYYSIFHSNLIYAIQVWSCVNESSLKSLLIKQKSAIRIISQAKYNSHTEPLFKQHKILPLNLLTKYFKIQFKHRFVYGFLPESFSNTWTLNRIRRADQSHVELRNDNRFFLPFVRIETLKFHPLISFPKLWEDFPDESIKFTREKIEFNYKLKNFFLDTLSPYVQCTRLFCPSCINS